MIKKPKGYRGGDAAKSDRASGRSAGRADERGSVDRSAVGAGSQFAKNQAKLNLEIQRKKAIQTISPSTTFTGQALKYGLMFSGVPFSKKITESLLDTGSSMGYGKNKISRTTNKNIVNQGSTKFTNNGGDSRSSIPPIVPITATKPIDQSLISPKDNFFNFKAYNVGGLSGGVRYGPPPKSGPNSQVPPIKLKRGSKK